MHTVPGAAHFCFSLLCVMGILGIGQPWRGVRMPVGTFLRAHWVIVAAMAALPAVILCSHLVNGLSPRIPYTYLRFALFGLIAWTLTAVPSRWLMRMQWGFVASAVASAIHIALLTGDGRPVHVGMSNAIPFGDLSLLLGMLSLLSLGWRPPGGAWRVGLKLLGAAAGLYASYLSESRGGWLALPLFAVLAFSLAAHWTRAVKLTVIVLLVAAAGSTYYASSIVRERITQGVTDLVQYEAGAGRNTSMGFRLQLWKASWLIFREHPGLGVGQERFPAALATMARRHVITPAASTFAHSHNELLFAMATLGLPGLLATAALYLAPGWYFARHVLHPDRFTQTAAVMGLALCAGFVVFGLTEVMFIISMTNAFYTLTAAALFAAIVRRGVELRALAPRPGHAGVPADGTIATGRAAGAADSLFAAGR